MAGEEPKQSFLSVFFPTNQDSKPNYYPIMDQTLSIPRLSSYITPIPIPIPIPKETPSPCTSMEDWSPDHSLGEESESAIRVVRSLVSGFLLKRSEKHEQFVPISSDDIMYMLKHDRLIAPFEKRALLDVGHDDEDEYETCIFAINFALLSIETDTGAINCYRINKHLNGVVKKRVEVLSIQPDQLAKELLPFQFHLEDLSVSPEELFPNLEDEEKTEMERLRALLHYDN